MAAGARAGAEFGAAGRRQLVRVERRLATGVGRRPVVVAVSRQLVELGHKRVDSILRVDVSSLPHACTSCTSRLQSIRR